jgi:hypothetical protein
MAQVIFRRGPRRSYVMARLDRAIGINTMERMMARSSLPMTKKDLGHDGKGAVP